MADINDVMEKLVELETKIGELEAKMDEPKSIQTICNHCGGDGVKATGNGDISCPDCGGDGAVPFGRITKTEDE